ncbi:hypothetical protein SPONN_593 [uncultured Candidatus Thioglobus sp.]|nr:hypothetical protein SPONN_593 [uncultured Candidatus Thioglobus sp.]
MGVVVHTNIRCNKYISINPRISSCIIRIIYMGFYVDCIWTRKK